MYLMRAVFIGVSSLVSVFYLTVPTPAMALILIDDVMTKEEKIRTGISKLNHQQILALEDWLNENFTLKTRSQDAKPAQEDLYLSENLNDGKRIRLSDGSLYEVAPSDVRYSALWLTPFPLKIVNSNDPAYPYKLVNTNTGFGVKARQIEGPRE
jgi:hypothetical protein